MIKIYIDRVNKLTIQILNILLLVISNSSHFQIGHISTIQIFIFVQVLFYSLFFIFMSHQFIIYLIFIRMICMYLYFLLIDVLSSYYYPFLYYHYLLIFISYILFLFYLYVLHLLFIHSSFHFHLYLDHFLLESVSLISFSLN